MSDAEEIRRWQEAMRGEPVGEVLVDMSDELKELGIDVGDS